MTKLPLPAYMEGHLYRQYKVKTSHRIFKANIIYPEGFCEINDHCSNLLLRFNYTEISVMLKKYQI